jgi:hypothetical protein
MNAPKYKGRETLLKGKDQYNIPPCTYLVAFYTENAFILFSQNKAS